MASACPMNNEMAVNTLLEILREVASKVPTAAARDIKNTMINIEKGQGMLLRSGREVRYEEPSAKRPRKGGMFKGGPKGKKTATAAEVSAVAAASVEAEGAAAADPQQIINRIDALPEAERNELLNSIAHIIAAGGIAGVSGLGLCLIMPAISAFLTSAGFLPVLCTGKGIWGTLEWATRGWGGTESCMDAQNRYNSIVLQYMTYAGIPSISAIVAARGAITEKYIGIQNQIYNRLVGTVKLFKSNPAPAAALVVATEESASAEGAASTVLAAAEASAASASVSAEELQISKEEGLERFAARFASTIAKIETVQSSVTPEQQQKIEIKTLTQELLSPNMSPSPGYDATYTNSTAFGGRKRKTRRKHIKRKTHKKRKTNKRRHRKSKKY